ncbi:DJ-1/PfpI family protein [Carnobacterium gallinarum]|uniref:DJ-1/PfpI family protein n=1 Tax=Carnobacterium gallinarum TaxID=2749 RepID=UPI00054D757D|nr:DJ-1/PfpI family protein [Carnobacterium gallinarum]
MKKIMLLLADGFEAVEASVFTDVLGWNQLEGDGTTEVVTVGLRSPLQCTWNFSVIPEKLVSEIDLTEFDALVIPGGFESAGFFKDAYSQEFSEIIRYFAINQKLIGTICVAALSLGNAGVLKGRKATTYSHPTSIRLGQLADFGAVLQPDPIVVDGNMITSYNPGTAFEVAFLTLEKLTSRENMLKVKDLMGFNEK